LQDRVDHNPGVDAVTRPPKAALLLLFSGLAIAGFLILNWKHSSGFFGDPRVYACAFEEWRAGRDPYGRILILDLYFLYPPIFLYLEAFLTRLFSAPGVALLYIAANIIAICALPLLLTRSFFRQAWLSPWFALLLFFASPRFTGAAALVEMNVAACLYLSCLGAAVPGIRRNQWQWFYLAVFFAAIIKGPFLGLLILPLIAGEGQWIQSIACVVSVALANLGERALWPQLYQRYLSSLTEGILVQQTYGYGIFGILASYHRRQRSGLGIAPYVAYAVMMAVMLGVLLLLKRRLKRSGARAQDLSANSHWLGLVLIAAILANPRQMKYDMDIASFVAYILWVYVLRTRRYLTLMTLLLLPSLAVPLFVLNPHLHGMYETFLVLTVFGLGCWRLWQEGGVGPESTGGSPAESTWEQTADLKLGPASG
jgi:hypothetical protein